jgi:hypothetical protein
MPRGAERLVRWPLVVGAAACFALIAAMSVWLAYVGAFSIFQAYDDEGYILISLDGYLSGAPLYDAVYSQYGPFFYLAMGSAIRIFELELTHDTARFLTIGTWILTSLTLGISATAFTRSLLLGLATQVLAFGALYPMVNEPLHPGGLATMLLAMAVLVLVVGVRRWTTASWVVLGGLIAATALVKVNVGGFAAVALAFSVVVSTERLWRLLPLRLLASALMILTPVALTAADLDQPWALRYALLVALAASALVLVTWRVAPSTGPGWRHVSLGVGGAVAVVVGTAVLTLVGGTSLDGLVEGSILDPLGQPRAFTLPFQMPAYVIFLGILAVGAAAGVARWRVRHGRHSVGTGSALVRIGAGLGLWASVAATGRLEGFPLALGLPLAWVAAVPPRGTATGPPNSAIFVRTSLSALAILGALHAYPVAGSQMAWSGVLFLPLGALCLHDGWTQLRMAARPNEAQATSLLRNGAPALLVLTFILWFVFQNIRPVARANLEAYRAGVAPRLPGAHRLRIPAPQASTYETLATQVRRRCSTFVSLPGMNSFHFFTGQQPPTWLNATAWMYLLDSSDQRRVVDRVRSIDNLCVLRNDGLLGFWSQGRPLQPGPLVRYMERGFTVATDVGDYQVLVRGDGAASG